ncbi:MAG: aldo/keto reductase [Bacteroidia bacterium]|nr:aldo/keto reductase [Bacteroidia bacterium]
MNYRTLGKTKWKISDVSLGTWQVGGKWGQPFDPKRANEIIRTAIDNGVNFIDTADVYSDGLSEQAVSKAVKETSEKVFIASKCGRRLSPHNADGYNRENITRFVEESLQRMKIDTIDLIQLHCPPTEVFERPEVFGILDDLREQGKIRRYGVSVEKVEEAMKAIKFPNVATVQIIFNLFRLKPAEEFFAAAQKANVGILARVPLASGLLSGKMNLDTKFGEHDHRNFNRNGEAFDKGETFSGVDYALGLKVVKEYIRLFGEEYLVQHALRWILMHEAVSCVIPGASSVDQVLSNVMASEIPALPELAMEDVLKVYDTHVREHVHHLW